MKGNEGLVHHLLVYACNDEIDSSDHNAEWKCFTELMPSGKNGLEHCNSVLAAWAIGGEVSQTMS